MATITQLKTFGPVLAKRWHRGADGIPVETGYDKAAFYAVTEHQVGSLVDLARVLDGIATDRRSCVIRGRPKADCPLSRTARANAHFADSAQSWSAHDFDSLECPPWLDPMDEPGAAVAYLRSLMPPEFHEAACWWSFTGSQGFKPGLRMRLVFWHDLPLTCADLKLWLGERQPDASKPRAQWTKLYPIDVSLYQQVQQIFTAAPVLADGIPDLVPLRSGILPGRLEMVPTPYPIRPRYGTAAVSVASAQAASLPREHAGSGYAYHRSRIGDEADGFHEPILAALSSWYTQHGSEADAAPIIADLAVAARNAPRRPGGDRRADVEARILALPRVAEWIREQQSASERKRDAVGALCAAPSALPTLSLAEAETTLSGAVAAAFVDCRRFLDFGPPFYDPPCIGIGAGIGIGKTAAAIGEIIRLVAERPGVRIAFAVPTHKTGDDIASRLNATAGLRIAASWRGPSQPDPDRPGCTMCRVPELAARVQSATGGLWSVCGRPDRGLCRHNPRRKGIAPADACGYRQQKGSDAVVWIVPHAMLGSAPPKTLPRFDMLVIDEAPWLTLLEGLDGNQPIRIPLSALLRPRRIGQGSNLGQAYFAATIDRLRNALSRSDGLLRRAVLVDAGLTALDAWVCASELEHTYAAVSVPHGLSETEALVSLGPVLAERRETRLVTKVMLLVADFLTSGAAVAPETLRVELDAPDGPSLRLRSRRDINAGWSRGPVLHLDATLIQDVATHWLPRLEITAAVRARETAVHRVQVYDRQNGKTGLVGTNEAKGEERRRKQAALRQLIEVLAFDYRDQGAPGGPDVLVLTYKALAPRLNVGMPPNVAFGHFSAARGFDGWRGVRVVIVIGRPLPAQRDTAIAAAVASGRLGEHLGAEYDLAAQGALLMRDGSGRRVLTAVHPDPQADAFRRQVLTEVEQAEGRARGVRRTSSAPLLSILLTAYPTELPVDEAIAQSDLLDGVGLLMLLAARGVVPGNARDAAEVLADAFEGEADRAAAFRARLSRLGSAGLLERVVKGAGPGSSEPVTPPYIVPNTVASQVRGKQAEPRPKCFRSFRAYRYRRLDCRSASVALIDTQRHRDPRAALAAAVGELALFERAASPAWLAEIRSAHPYSLPAHRFPPAPSAVTAILGTDHRERGASTPVLPVADDILSVQYRGKRVSMHVYDTLSGAPLILIRTPDASWPPRRKHSEPRLFSAADVAAAVGVSWPSVRDLMTDIQAQERVDAVGFDRAAVEAISRHVGADRVGTAVADLGRRSGS